MGKVIDATNITYNGTVAIYDASGNHVDYTADPQIVFNYYPFSVTHQLQGVIPRIEIQMKDLSVKGKIEITKYGEKLVGFKKDGDRYEPIYEMRALPGVSFDVMSAEDVTLLDGVSAPKIFDALGRQVVMKVSEWIHNQFPNAIRLEEAELPDGTEVYYVTEAEAGAKNMSYATLLTSTRKGTWYELEYELTDDDGYVSTITFRFGLEYAAGGWNFTEVHILKETVWTDENGEYDYTGGFPDSELPEIKNGDSKISLATASYANGNKSELLSPVANTWNIVPHSDASFVAPVSRYALESIRKYNYLDGGEILTATPFTDYTRVSGVDDVYLYVNDFDAEDFIIAIINASNAQEFVPCPAEGVEYTNKPDDSDIPDGYEWLSIDKNHLPDGYTWIEVTDVDLDVPAGFDWLTVEIGDSLIYNSAEGVLLVAGKQYLIHKIAKLPDDPDYDPDETDLIMIALDDSHKKFIDWAYVANVDEDGAYTNKPIIPDGYEMTTLNLDTMYVIYNQDTGDYMLWAEDFLRDTKRWIHCDQYGTMYGSRTQSVDILLTQHNTSQDGWSVTFEGLTLTSFATNEEVAKVTVYNPSAEEPVILDGVGCDIVTENGLTTILVPHPEAKAYFQLENGIRTSIVYNGGFSKTILYVPEGADPPVIVYQGKQVDYQDEAHLGLTPDTPVVETQFGNGNYIRATLVQPTQARPEEYMLVEIVSDATTEANAFKVIYYDGHESYSVVTNDANTGERRGMLVFSAETKTLKYPLGVIVETITTDANGLAVTGLLPLGEYIIRENTGVLGQVATNASYTVSLEYAGQYVPLVWTSASAENEAVSIQLDISKEFQKVYGEDEYEPKAGAVFGVYVYSDEIAASTAPTNSHLVDSSVAEAGTLIAVVTTDEDGKAVQTIKLPFGEYYVQEISTLEDYVLNDQRFIFKVDETAWSDKLTFNYELDGIDGKVTQTGLNVSEIEIQTLFRIPSQILKINGHVLDTADDATFLEDCEVTNVVNADRSITTIKAVIGHPVVVEFGNGGILTVTAGSNGYEAVFSGDLTNLETDIGLAANIGETKAAGKWSYVYDPVVRYSGYTAEVASVYVVPETYIEMEYGVIARYVNDLASGNRLVVISYPEDVDMPLYYEKDPNCNGDDWQCNGTCEWYCNGNCGCDPDECACEPGVYNEDCGADCLSSDLCDCGVDCECEFQEGLPRPEWLTVDLEARTITVLTNDLEEDVAVTVSAGTLPIIPELDDKGKPIIPEEPVEPEEIGMFIITRHAASTDLEYDGDYNDGYESNIYTRDGEVADEGYQRDSLVVHNGILTHNMIAKTLNLYSANRATAIYADIAYDFNLITAGVKQGTVLKAYENGELVEEPLDQGYFTAITMQPGNSLSIFTSDGARFVVGLDEEKRVIMTTEGIVNGVIDYDENNGGLNLVELNGSYKNLKIDDGTVVHQIFPLLATTFDEVWLRLAQSLTYQRNDSFVNQLQVKINAGTSTLMPTAVYNDRVQPPPEPEEPVVVIEPPDTPKGGGGGGGGGGSPPPTPVIVPTPEPETEYITINKIDVTSGEFLAGAEIEVKDIRGDLVFRGVTDSTGGVTFEKPEPGLYYYRETAAPEGYILNKEEYVFTIDAAGVVRGSLEIGNIPEDTVVISKEDTTTAEELPGAEIVIYDEDGNEVFRGITDSHGKIYFRKPQPGKYTFIETVAPEGYFINETTFSFTVNEDGSITGDHTILDVPKKVIISKTDVTDGKELPGAEIVIWDEEGNEVFRGVSDEFGKIYFEAPGPGRRKCRHRVCRAKQIQRTEYPRNRARFSERRQSYFAQVAGHTNRGICCG